MQCFKFRKINNYAYLLSTDIYTIISIFFYFKCYIFCHILSQAAPKIYTRLLHLTIKINAYTINKFQKELCSFTA